MDTKFVPPKDQKEFEERADKMSLEGARNVKEALESRRKSMVANIDLEIEHLDKVVKHKENKLTEQNRRD